MADLIEAMLSFVAMAGLTDESKPLEGAPPFTIPPSGKVEAWRSMLGGHQARISFPNGYEASVVRHRGSYGSKKGLWELAVCRADTGKLVYDTPITNDVEGHMTEQDVADLLVRMAALPARTAP